MPALRRAWKRLFVHPQTRAQAAAALVRLGEVEPRDVLLRQTRSRRADVRGLALELLGDVGGTWAVEALLQGLEGRSPDAAARALGALGDRSAVPALRRALQRAGDDEELRLDLEEAIERLESPLGDGVDPTSTPTLRSDLAMELFDTHTHLDIGPLSTEVDDVLARARAVGVTRVAAIGVVRRPEDVERTVALARQHAGVVATVGVHPHDARHADPGLLGRIEEAAADEAVVAVGEIGLDYYYTRSPQDVQRRVFREQLRLARRVDQPVVLHLREATEDALRILREEGLPPSGGVVHCYSETPEVLDDFLDLGLYISFSGIVTFPRAEPLREAARRVPDHRLLVETDAPYLAPVPHRGKTNEAAFVLHTAQTIADLRDVPLERLAEQTFANGLALYRIPPDP